MMKATSTLQHVSNISFTEQVKAMVLAMWETVTIWRNRAHQRRQLLEMETRILKDLGLTRMDAIQEAEKPFWRM